jgi:hypothetical protein
LEVTEFVALGDVVAGLDVWADVSLRAESGRITPGGRASVAGALPDLPGDADKRTFGDRYCPAGAIELVVSG